MERLRKIKMVILTEKVKPGEKMERREKVKKWRDYDFNFISDLFIRSKF